MALYVVLDMPLGGFSVEDSYYLVSSSLEAMGVSENSDALVVEYSLAFTEHLVGIGLLLVPRHAMPGMQCLTILTTYVVASFQVRLWAHYRCQNLK